MYVTKASGKKEEFKPKKVLGTLLRAGASRELADKVVKEVKEKVRDGTTTKEILKTTLKLLKKKKPEVGAIYDLKRAIMSLGPTGFPFEKFFAEILRNYGYEVQLNRNLKGKLISHEIDIIAKKDFTYMVENKYHGSVGLYTNSKVALYTYARFLDLKEKFDYPWLVTNTRLSPKAAKYAKGVKMKVTSWQYPKNENLRDLIENKKLYPITILKSVDESVKLKLFNSKIMLVLDLLKYNLEGLSKKTGISKEMSEKIIEEAQKIYNVKVGK